MALFGHFGLNFLIILSNRRVLYPYGAQFILKILVHIRLILLECQQTTLDILHENILKRAHFFAEVLHNTFRQALKVLLDRRLLRFLNAIAQVLVVVVAKDLLRRQLLIAERAAMESIDHLLDAAAAERVPTLRHCRLFHSTHANGAVDALKERVGRYPRALVETYVFLQFR